MFIITSICSNISLIGQADNNESFLQILIGNSANEHDCETLFGLITSVCNSINDTVFNYIKPVPDIDKEIYTKSDENAKDRVNDLVL